jgi:hypothetical protein
MISLFRYKKESLDRDNLLWYEAIIMACTCFEYWLVTLHLALSSGHAFVLLDYNMSIWELQCYLEVAMLCSTAT